MNEEQKDYFKYVWQIIKVFLALFRGILTIVLFLSALNMFHSAFERIMIIGLGVVYSRVSLMGSFLGLGIFGLLRATLDQFLKLSHDLHSGRNLSSEQEGLDAIDERAGRGKIETLVRNLSDLGMWWLSVFLMLNEVWPFLFQSLFALLNGAKTN